MYFILFFQINLGDRSTTGMLEEGGRLAGSVLGSVASAGRQAHAQKVAMTGQLLQSAVTTVNTTLGKSITSFN